MHVQLDLSDFTVAAVNTTGTDAGSVTVHAAVYSLQNQQLLTHDAQLSLIGNHTATAFQLALAPLFAKEGVVLVKLEMRGGDGKLLSENVYWLAAEEKEYRRLNALAPVRLRSSATMHAEGTESVINLQLSNEGTAAALATKAVLVEAETGQRILPAYFSDNYITLLPGETRTLTVRFPTNPSIGKAGRTRIDLRGWNVDDASVVVSSR